MTGRITPILVLKRMPGHFFENSTTQENIRISKLKKRLQHFYKKENFRAEIKPMIQNLQLEHGLVGGVVDL